MDKTIANDAATRETLKKMRDLALDLTNQLGIGHEPDVLGNFLHENWELKRTLDEGVTSSKIDRWYSKARKAGALGGKLLGAGGGGFLLFYVPEGQQAAVRRALSELRELPIRLESDGARIVHITP
jgi:D-glycero-alpha-D-manno-heptose-7-phosphate kinase